MADLPGVESTDWDSIGTPIFVPIRTPPKTGSNSANTVALSTIFAPSLDMVILILRIGAKRPIEQKLLPIKETVMNIDDLILALLIHRDNHGPHLPITVKIGDADCSLNQVKITTLHGAFGSGTAISLDGEHGKPSFKPNHMREMPAREADDLRKMSHHFLAFRQAVCEFASTKYTSYDPEDPQRFKRLRSQMVETARDLTYTMGHIDGECAR